MAARLFQDEIPLLVPPVRTLLPGESGYPDPAYPFPVLLADGPPEVHPNPVYLLENDLVRVAFSAALGGRIVSVTDRRTGREVFADGSLDMGWQWTLSGAPRGNAVREVPALPAESEEESPALWFAEVVADADDLSAHIRWELEGEAAILRGELRVFNRSDHRKLIHPGSLAGPCHPGASWAQHEPEFPILLGPGETAMVPFTLTFWTGMPTDVDAYPDLVLGRDGAELIVQSHRKLAGARIVLRSPAGDQQANVDLYPEHARRIALPGIELTEVVVFDATGTLITPESLPTPEVDVTPETRLRAEWAVRGGPGRPAAWRTLAYEAMRSGDAAAALDAWQNRLNFDAEDVLAWAHVEQLRRETDPDSATGDAIANAHFLAPMEPFLRADAFLQMDPHMGKEGSPLVAPLAEFPETMVAAASELIRVGALDRANRWIDECLRHTDIPLLRIIMAYTLWKGTRMRAEAAMHLRQLPDEPYPPYPFRTHEWQLLAEVLEAFPEETRLAKWQFLGKYER